MPAGLEVIRSPLRPLAVTVKLTFAVAGFTVSVAVRDTPPNEPAMIAELGKRSFSFRTHPVRVERAVLGGDAGLIGAARLPLESTV